MQHWRRFLAFMGYVIDRFVREDFFNRASSLTFTTLLAVVPLMVVSFAIFSAFPASDHVRGQVQDFIFSNFVATKSDVMTAHLQQFAEKASKMSTVSLLLLLVTAVMMLRTVEKTLNHIWQVDQKRHLISACLLYWAMLTLTPLLLGSSLALSSYLLSLKFLGAANVTASAVVLKGLMIVMEGAAFSILYIAMPNCRVPFKEGFIGALVATFLFELAKRGFSLYVTHFPTYEVIYGAMASVPLFLLWVYVSWMIVLSGGLISQALTVDTLFVNRRPVALFVQAFQWLRLLYQAQHNGAGLSLQELIRDEGSQAEAAPASCLRQLLQEKLIVRTAKGKYILARDLNAFTLADFYRALPWPLPSPSEIEQETLSSNRALKAILTEADADIARHLDKPMASLFDVTAN